MLEWGDLFGPWVAGDEGCELYGFIAGEGAPFAGDESLFEALLKEQGAERVGLPMPKRLPPWSQTKFAQSSVVDWTEDAP
jgi:hypothetical protein